MRNLIGQQIAHYRVENLLGEGASARVYLARHVHNNQLVALKVMHDRYASDREKIQVFFRQVESQQQLDHPNIIRIFEYGSINRLHYIVMQYIRGGTLNGLLSRYGPLPATDVSRILSQIAAALHFAHERGVYHRDIKPANILISADRSQAFLTDFGIARIVGRETITPDDHQILGTLQFMSPEQVRSEPLDGRSDIYSLGITLYVALSGKLPFDGAPAAILYHQANTDHYPLRRIDPNIPPAAERIVNRALRKDPNKRYRSASALQRDLERLAYPRANPMGFAAIAFLVVAVFGIAVFLFGGTDPDVVTPATPTAVSETLDTSTLAFEELIDEVETLDPNAIVIMSPQVGASFPSGGSSEVLVSWEWPGTLEEDEEFQINFTPNGGGTVESPYGPRRGRRALLDLSRLRMITSYNVTIAVVERLNDGSYIVVDNLESEPVLIHWRGP